MKRLGAVLALLAGAAAMPKAPADEGNVRPSTATTVMSSESVSAQLSAALMAETNRVRRAHGRRALQALPGLSAAADDQASYMALTLHTAHGNVLRQQHDVAERVQRHGVRPATVAENVAADAIGPDEQGLTDAALAARLVSAWMNSPGHRANLLNRNFTHCGCAARVARGIKNVEYVFGVQVFSTSPSSANLRI